MINSPGEQFANPVAASRARRVIASRRTFFGLLACSVIAPVFAQDTTHSKSDSPEAVTQKTGGEQSTDSKKADSKASDSGDQEKGKTDDTAKDKDKAKNKDKTKEADGKVHLITSDLNSRWKYFSAESGTRLSDVWRVQKDDDPKKNVLICKGMPEGYLRTDIEFDDFEMELEWMYPTDENGNSGVLLHVAPKDKIWPDSIQLQLHRPTAGSIFPSGAGKSENTLESRDLSVELNKWNKCKIVSRGEKLTVEFNGKKLGEVRGCSPSRGRIALQSEGSEIHFRNVWIRKLKPATPKSTVEADTEAKTDAAGT